MMATAGQILLATFRGDARLDSAVESAGYDCLRVTTAADAESLLGVDPRALIVDVVGASVESFALLGEMAARVGEHMPIIAVTSAAGDEQTRALDAGADEIVTENHATAAEILVRIRCCWRLRELQAEIGVLREALAEDPRRDDLTGLWTWDAMYEYVARDLSWAQRYDRSVSLLFVSIDQVSSDVDTSPADERLVAAVANLLRRTVRDTDLICRYDSGEFVVLATEANCEEARLMAERLGRLAPGAVASASGQTLTFSIGVACSRAVDVERADDLLRHASSAIERAKRAGGGRIESVSVRPDSV